jgi:hypothetical protein
MSSNDTSRPIGTKPITDAASATAPDTSQQQSAATIAPDDFDNRNAEAPATEQAPETPDQMDEENEADMLQQSGSEVGTVDEHGHQPRDQQFTPVE